MKAFKLFYRVEDISFPPERCSQCKRKLSSQEKVVCYQDETGFDLIEGWICEDCAKIIDEGFEEVIEMA